MHCLGHDAQSGGNEPLQAELDRFGHRFRVTHPCVRFMEMSENWAALQGDAFAVGSCRAACKACKVCTKSDSACQAENRLNAGFLPMHLDDWE